MIDKFVSYLIAAIGGLLLGLALVGTVNALWGLVGIGGLLTGQLSYQMQSIENELRAFNGKKPK